MRESCSATACSLTRSRPHRLASLWRSLSPSSSPRRSFHGNSRISSGFHGGGQGNVSHNASGFEYRCVTNSPLLHSRSVLLLHCVKNENKIDKFKKSIAELKMHIIIRPLYMMLNHPESNNIYGAILCLLTSNCNLINETTWLFCCSYNNERTTIVKWKCLTGIFWGGVSDKNLDCINFQNLHSRPVKFKWLQVDGARIECCVVSRSLALISEQNNYWARFVGYRLDFIQSLRATCWQIHTRVLQNAVQIS